MHSQRRNNRVGDGRLRRTIFRPSIHPNIYIPILLLVMLASKFTSGQDVPATDDQKKDDYIEQLTEDDENNTGDYESLVDLDKSIRDHPINLNSSTADEMKPLLELSLITDVLLNAILSYREKMGKLISIFELQAIPYIDIQIIKTILPYIKVSSDINNIQVTLKDLLVKGDYTFLIREQQVIEKQKGFTSVDTSSILTSRYLGSAAGIYTRFRYQHGTKFSYGITAQKDAGEEFFKGSERNGFDFYSFHLYYRGNKILKAVSLGDYEVKFGQGLIIANGFGTGKSSMVMNVKNGGRTLRPYTSTNEGNFFRGAAAVFGSNNMAITAFASHKKIDGNAGAVDTAGENVNVTSIGGSGYHRTTSELGNKNTLTQTVFGGNLDFRIHSLLVGASIIHTNFSSPLEPNFQPYNQFRFHGDELTTAGIHYDWQHQNFNLFGEGAMDEDGGKAVISGMLISIDPRVDFSLVYRNYRRNFHSLYANDFGESSTNDNEQGLYNGIVIRPARAWEIDAYVDLFKKPWLGFLVDAPSTGTDILLQVSYRPNKVLEIYGRWKDESKQQNTSLHDEAIDYLVNVEKQNFRFNLTYKAGPAFTIRSRAEWVFYKDQQSEMSHGFLAYQDLMYRKLGSPFQLTGRICLFDAETYDARIYAYETDVLYAFSIPSFSNRGMRFYLVARYALAKGLDIWLRFAQTYYSNIDVIGTSLDEIDGNKKSEVKMEMRYRF